MSAKTLKIKTRVSQPYGHTEYQCHICKDWNYVTAKYIHYTTLAKKEALSKELGEIKNTPHLDFYVENTKEVVTRVWNIILE